MPTLIHFPGTDAALLQFRHPLRRITARNLAQVIPAIAAAADEAAAGRWVVGFVAYEAAPAFDPAMPVGPPMAGLPLAEFSVFARPEPPAAAPASDGFRCGPWSWCEPPSRHRDAMDQIRQRISAGDYYQVNLTTRLACEFSGDPLALFASLRSAQPDAYAACIEHEDGYLLSVSPELFFDWQPDGLLTTRPMKGTAPRWDDPAADQATARALRESPKEQAENVMIVDLLRNDLSRIAEPGTVRVPDLLTVEALPSLWQMTSTITARTRPQIGLVDVFRALFPCGSITGAPKLAAMAAITQLESSPRGAYCGAIGLIRPGGHATFNVGIRTVQVDTAGGRALCGVGSGITADSDNDAEYAEWVAKRRFLLRASAAFELLETLGLEAGAYPLKSRHLGRMAASARHFGFAFPRPALETALARVAADHPTGAWRVRLLLERNGKVSVDCAPAPVSPPSPVISLARSAVRSDDEFLAHKTTAREIYEMHAPGAGMFDTLLWNERGELTEFTRGNLVVEMDGRQLTPAARCGLLPGVLRAELLERGLIEEALIPLRRLPDCTRLWFINGLRGWVEVKLQPS